MSQLILQPDTMGSDWTGGYPWGSRVINQYRFHDENTFEVQHQKGSFLVDREVWNEFLSSHPRTSVYLVPAGYVMFQDTYLHRWTAETYLPEPEDETKTTVDHINRQRTDNRVSNLRWASMSEQNRNRSKIPKKERDVPELWPGFTYQDVAAGIQYNPANGPDGENFVVSGTKFKSSKDKKITALQKYEEALLMLQKIELAKPEKHTDRLGEIEDHIEIAKIRLKDIRVRPKKSAHTSREFTIVVDANDMEHALLSWKSGDAIVNQVVFPVRFREAVEIASPDKDGRVKYDKAKKAALPEVIPGCEDRLPEDGSKSRLADFIFTICRGMSLENLQRVGFKNGNPSDLRDENLVAIHGHSRKPNEKTIQRFEKLISGDRSMTFDEADQPVVALGIDAPSSIVEVDSSAPPPIVRKTDSHYVIWDAETDPYLKDLKFDGNSLDVELFSKGVYKPFIRENPKYLKIAERIPARKISLMKFVCLFVLEKDIPPGYCVSVLNNFRSDVRSKNLVILPGNNAKVERSEVPEDIRKKGIDILPFRVRFSPRLGFYGIDPTKTSDENRIISVTRTGNYMSDVNQVKNRLRKIYNEIDVDYDQLNADYLHMCISRQAIIASHIAM